MLSSLKAGEHEHQEVFRTADVYKSKLSEPDTRVVFYLGVAGLVKAKNNWGGYWLLLS